MTLTSGGPFNRANPSLSEKLETKPKNGTQQIYSTMKRNGRKGTDEDKGRAGNGRKKDAEGKGRERSGRRKGMTGQGRKKTVQ
jgi:hypothetical protein